MRSSSGMPDGEDSSRTALVTGAATGIGLAIVRVLAEQGWRVLGTALPGQATPAIDASLGVQFLEVDLADEASRQHLIGRLAREHRLDAVVSNAGIAVPAPLEVAPLDELRRQFEINTIAPIMLARALLPRLRDVRGRLIFIGAGQGRVALPFGGPYAASKAALAAMTDSLRAEIADTGVTVSLIEPGAIRTAILEESRVRASMLLDELPDEMAGRYRRPLEATFARSEKAFRRASAPQRIAHLIAGILESPAPKPRYLIGRDAVALAFVAHLPARWRARLVARLMT
ncbi:SDR family NAD(P)-dependent oxidoreductase [Microbacterium oxydans]|uniref:SDR family NAD(P)-dependent oxidoreductase n=1 Tax=Microbacterium oxydans TaxID=82380 RepID=UPI00363E6D91